LIELYQNPAVPAVSVATLSGTTVLTGARGCTPATLFQAASISKPVAAMAVLALVGQRRLALDDDVNTHLNHWHVPNSALFPGTITVRQLLCHASGLGVQSYPGYLPNAAQPTLLEVLDGMPPAITPAVRRMAVPGTEERYSGGGYTVLQQLIEDVSGQSFAACVQRLVLTPCGMTTATYTQPTVATAAQGHARGAVLPQGWRVYPELAAAGLWCTPTDLLRFAAAIQAAIAGEPNAFLPQAVARELITEQAPHRGWGLGLELKGTGFTRWFEHAGANDGYRCEFSGTIEQGMAVAIMTNGEAGGHVIARLMPALHDNGGWLDPAAGLPRPAPAATLPISAEQIGPIYGGRYRLDDGSTATLQGVGWRWELVLPTETIPLEVLSATAAVGQGVDLRIAFTLDAGSGLPTGFTLAYRGVNRVATR
jgi:CubicO group peptidase (beta-lactamase class C family)